MVKATLINLPDTVAIAILVIGGEFGNGEERKEKLKNAGYDYNAIQQCVNQLLPIIKEYE